LFMSDLDITPAIVHYSYHNNGVITVNLANVTAKTVVIPPKAILCEIQPVKIEDIPDLSHVDTLDDIDILDQVTIPSDLEENLLQQGTKLLRSYSDIFSKGDLDLGHSTTVQHRIELDNTTPFKQRHRSVPPAMIYEVRDHIRQLLACGVIRKSHSPWASGVVLVRKKDGSLRMCIDYTQFNQRTIKDSYALPRIEEILDSLSGATYFCIGYEEWLPLG